MENEYRILLEKHEKLIKKHDALNICYRNKIEYVLELDIKKFLKKESRTKLIDDHEKLIMEHNKLMKEHEYVLKDYDNLMQDYMAMDIDNLVNPRVNWTDLIER